MSSAKEHILKKIRQGLSYPAALPFPNSEGAGSVFQPSPDELEIQFAEEFAALRGKFSYCASVLELREQLGALFQNRGWQQHLYCRELPLRELLSPLSIVYTDDLPGCAAALTSCECLVARTGSILMSSGQQSGRTTSVYAPVHVCIAYIDQLVWDIKDGIQLIREKYPQQMPSVITLASGPSRTADIEKTLVVGIHGPREVFVFLVER